jgi:type II secretory pathway predicted ATPase ExeA
VKSIKKALIAMKNGILENKGFISLTGDFGTGKTILVNALADILGDIIFFAQVSDPSLEQLNFLNLSVSAFKMNENFSTQGDFLSHLRHFLNNIYIHRKEVVLVFEEAQKFNPGRLEEVRLILNLQPDKKLISIVSVGQIAFYRSNKKKKV